MSETETDPNPFAAVTWPESYTGAPESADNSQPATTTLTEPTPPENAVSGATELHWESHSQAQSYSAAVSGSKLDDIARRCGGGGVTMSQIGPRKHLPTSIDEKAADTGAPERTDSTPPKNGVSGATGIEAAVCADIERRQRRGIAKYGKTVMANDLPFLAWLQHFYEELLDAAVYAKRIIHDHENQTQNQDDAGASGVLHRNPALHPSIPDAVPLRGPNGAGNDPTVCPGPAARPRKPGGGRKPLVCPSCGGVKTIGSSMKDGVPIKRCKVCGHVHKSYPHLANAAKAAP